MLPDNFDSLSSTKSKCLDPLDELCKALRVPYTVLDVSAGPRQAQGPTSMRIYRREELGDLIDPTPQNIDKATSEKYGDDYEVSIKKVGPDNRSRAQQIWDSYYPLWLAFGVVAGLVLVVFIGCCFCGCCRNSMRKQSPEKSTKADGERAGEEPIGPDTRGADLEMENVEEV